MKVFYSGVNLYGQFSTTTDDLIIKDFSEILLNEDILFYSTSLTYNVFATNNKIIIRGFFNGKPYQNFEFDFNTSDIRQIACNENHILILTKEGQVWQLNVLGDNQFKPITNFINTEINENDLTNTFSDTILTIYCGKNMNLALSNQGILYSIPTRINTNYVVKNMACGQEHGVLLSEKGKVYTWGMGTRGQLGHGDLEDKSEPHLVEALDGIKIIKIAAGGWHTAAISEDGDLYSWGWNSNGQLGFLNNSVLQSSENNLEDKKTKLRNAGESISVLTTPRPVDINNNLNTTVVNVACGMRHTIALLANGSIYGTGLNKYYQLGDHGKDIESICEMTLIKKDLDNTKKINIICGPYCSAYLLYD